MLPPLSALGLRTPREEIEKQFTEARQAVKEVTDNWWLFLVSGLAWFVVSLVVLRMNLTSVAAVGVLLGVGFLVSGAEEILIASVRSRRLVISSRIELARTALAESPARSTKSKGYQDGVRIVSANNAYA